MADRFTALFKRALSEYITYLLSMLDLNDWRITLLGTYPDGADAAASIKCVYGRRIGELALCKDFFDHTAEQQQHYIVHEITHVLTDACDNVIENGLSTIMGMPAFTVLQEAWRVQVEYLTDHLTYVIIDFLEDFPNNQRLWANVLRAEHDQLPLPDPNTAREGLAAPS